MHKVDKRTWEERSQEIKREIADLRNLSKDDPTLDSRIREISKRMRKLMDQEGVPGQPARVQHLRGLENKRKELRKAAPPVLAAIKDAIERECGKTWGDYLQFGCSLDLRSVAFDVWYDLDEELESDRESGRRAELVSIMKRAARQIANADANVRFHSRQYVEEKCDGNYFKYYRCL